MIETVGNILAVAAGVSVVGIFVNALSKARQNSIPALRPRREYELGDRIEISKRIIKYTGETGRKVGKFFAYTEYGVNNRVKIGFALCAPEDKYDEQECRRIAMERAEECFTKPLQIPHNIAEDFLDFYARCSRFFKRAEDLPVEFQLYNYDSKKYEDVVVDSCLVSLPNSEDWTTEYYFAYPETETKSTLIPLESVAVHEDCEPDH